MTKLGPICERPRENTKREVRKPSAETAQPSSWVFRFEPQRKRKEKLGRTARGRELDFRKMPSNLRPTKQHNGSTSAQTTNFRIAFRVLAISASLLDRFDGGLDPVAWPEALGELPHPHYHSHVILTSSRISRRWRRNGPRPRQRLGPSARPTRARGELRHDHLFDRDLLTCVSLQAYR